MISKWLCLDKEVWRKSRKEIHHLRFWVTDPNCQFLDNLIFCKFFTFFKNVEDFTNDIEMDIEWRNQIWKKFQQIRYFQQKRGLSPREILPREKGRFLERRNFTFNLVPFCENIDQKNRKPSPCIFSKNSLFLFNKRDVLRFLGLRCANERIDIILIFVSRIRSQKRAPFVRRSSK